MQRFGGLLFMLVSTAALGAYLTLPPPSDDVADLAEVTRISVAPYHPARSAETGTRTFSPASRAFRAVVDSGAGGAPAATQPGAATWVTVVRSEPSRSAVLRSATPGDARTRYQLARDLQRELKRAGCYGGEITGSWTPSTKRAMAAFMERANARLPIDAPDYILLSLMQSHDGLSCASECASGDVMSRSGRCVPDGVVAQDARPIQRPAAHQLAAAAPERLPWLDRDGRSVVAPAAQRAAPPAGMMSVGAPPPAASIAQRVWIEREDGTIVNDGGASAGTEGSGKIAALESETAQGDDSAFADTPPETLVPAKTEKRRRAKHSRDWQERPRYSGPKGRTRRGDPRPGTMRYNVAQVLGGIY